MAMDDPNLEQDAPAEEASSNRNFIIAAGALGVGFILILGVMLAFLFLVRPGQQAANQTAVAERNATNAAIEAVNNAQLTEEARPTNTPTPTDTPLPTATDTPVPPTDTPPPTATVPPTDTLAPSLSETPGGAAGGTGTPGTPGGPAAVTATPTRVGTAAATGARTATPIVGSLTRTPATATPSALSNTGFADDFGLPGLIALALGLIVVVIIVRRLRLSLR